MDTPSAEPHALLTDEEKLVLQLLARGRTLEEIAAGLLISVEAGRAYVRVILEKLHVHSRLEAVAAVLSRPDPPPPPPPAASAALAVPYQWAEDIPRHVGRPLPRKGGSGQQVV